MHDPFDHRLLHRSVLRAAAAGLAAGVAALALGDLLGHAAVPLLLPLLPAAVAATLVRAPARRRVRLAAAALGLLAGLIALHYAGSHPLFSAAVLGAGAGAPLGWRLPPSRWPLALAGAVLLALVGLPAAVGLVDGPLVSWLPVWAGPPVAGASLGFLLGFSAVPRMLGGHVDPVAEALEALGDQAPAEVLDLCRQAAQMHAATERALRAAAPGEARLTARVACTSRDLALSALALVRRWQEVEATADPGAEARLTEKLADLERRMVEADDEVARAGYERARDAVAGLLEQQRALGRGRERLVARLHQQVATLEALHLSTLHLKSADAQRFSCEVEPLLDQAAGLFVEVDDAARVTDALMQLG